MFLRKIGTIVTIFLVFSVYLYADITRNDAEDIVLNQIISDDIGNVDVFVLNTVQSNQNDIVISDRQLSCPYPQNWVFFVDDYVFANWAHPCRYIFVNEANGEYQIVNETMPPLDMSGFEKISEIDFTGENQLITDPEATIENSREPSDHLFAVIINGGYNSYYNWIRYWNDMSAIFCTITQVYGYKPENIYVHSSDGTVGNNHGSLNLDGPDYPEDDILYPAYESSIENTFQTLANEMGPDDQLLVYVTDHGDAQNRIILWGNETITTSELDAMLDPIDAAEIVVVMEQCYSGGFITNNNNITDPHRVIHTAANADEPSWAELWISNVNYDEFVFYWTAAARGRFPGDNPWELNEYEIEEFPFDDYFAYGPTHPDAYDPDLNGDGVVQMEEAFDYANNFDTWSPYGYYNTSYPEGHIGHPYVGTEEHPDSFHNIGFQEDLLSLSGLCGYVENTQTISGNFMVNPALTINPGVTLTIADGAEIYLLNGVEINLLNGAELIFEFGANIVIGDNVKFITPDGEESGIVRIMGSNPVYCNNLEFSNCELYTTNTRLEIHGGNFSKSRIEHLNSTLILDNIDFDQTPIFAEKRIYRPIPYYVDIQNCSVQNSDTYAVSINSYTSFTVRNNNISNNDGVGLLLYTNLDGTIENNHINNNGVGIHLNNTEADIIGYNYICNNYVYGIVAINNSNWSLVGINDYPCQTIAFNYGDNAEIYFQVSTIPDEVTFNKIYDANYNSEFIHCEGTLYTEINVANNFWGDGAVGGSSRIPTEENFYPSITNYPYDPVWNPGTPRGGDDGDAELLYLSGKELEVSENYAAAEQTYKDVISLYPASNYSKMAAKQLISVTEKTNQDFLTLKDYYDTEPNMTFDEEMVKVSSFLSNQCNIKITEFPEAIDWFENVISDPPSQIDSVLAVIDLGYTYLLMEENGDRGNYVGKFPNLKPNSWEEYEENTIQLLNELFGEPEIEPEEEPFVDIIPAIVTLHSNYPNPFNPTTTISFSMPEDSNVELTIFNIRGQMVKTLVNSNLDKGSHSIIWNGKDKSNEPVSSGVYFYKLIVNGKSESVKKCLLLK